MEVFLEEENNKKFIQKGVQLLLQPRRTFIITSQNIFQNQYLDINVIIMPNSYQFQQQHQPQQFQQQNPQQFQNYVNSKNDLQKQQNYYPLDTDQ